MNAQDIATLRSNFDAIRPIASDAAALFYGRLFELDPALRPLFRGDLRAQGEKLMTMIGAAVAGLDEPATLIPVLRDLGRRHAAYGVKDAHYGTVAAALLWTLEQGLGPAFDDRARGAWTAAYGLIAATMQQGAAALAGAGQDG